MLAGALAGAIVVMKANFALAFVPAIGLVFSLGLLRRPTRRAGFVGGLTVVVVSAVSYLATRGTSTPLELSVARMSEHLVLVANGERGFGSTGELFRWGIALLQHGGGFARIGTVMLYIVLVLLGWWLLAMLVAALFARWRGRRPFSHAPTTSLLVLLLLVFSTLMALFVAQRGEGSAASWNISLHTVRNLWWIGLSAAAVAWAAVCRGEGCSSGAEASGERIAVGDRATIGRAVSRSLQVLLAAAAVVFVAGSLQGVTSMKHSDTPLVVPTDLRVLLQRADERIPPASRIVQTYDSERCNWASALTGRGAVLERAVLGRDLYPERTAHLERAIATLYTTTDPDRARRAARDAQAEFAVVDLDKPSPRGLRSIAQVVDRSGRWVLLRLKI